MQRHYYRVSVDLDPAGNPIGSSWEVRSDDGPMRISVCPPPGPFDTPGEAFIRTWGEVVWQYGLTLRLL